MASKAGGVVIWMIDGVCLLVMLAFKRAFLLIPEGYVEVTPEYGEHCMHIRRSNVCEQSGTEDSTLRADLIYSRSRAHTFVRPYLS